MSTVDRIMFLVHAYGDAREAHTHACLVESPDLARVEATAKAVVDASTAIREAVESAR